MSRFYYKHFITYIPREQAKFKLNSGKGALLPLTDYILWIVMLLYFSRFSFVAFPYLYRLRRHLSLYRQVVSAIRG